MWLQQHGYSTAGGLRGSTVASLDGAHGEGGGQLLRSAVALSAVTGTGIRVYSIRERREPPGLAPQHLAAVRAVAELCGAATRGVELHSREIEFLPGRPRGGDFAFDVGTAGSVTLVAQALLPVMIAARGPVCVTVTGGTDVRAAPPLDYLRFVLLPLLGRMGVRVGIETLRRGYYPRGGGAVRLWTQGGELRPLVVEDPGRVIAVGGVAHVARLPARIAERMRDSAVGRLAAAGVEADCGAVVLGPETAAGAGGAVVLWAAREQSILGAGRVAERGVPAETLGAAAGEELAADLAAGGALDVHAADQVLVCCALAGGESRFTTRALTPHAHTAMWLIERMLGTRFEVEAASGLERVRVVPRPRP